MNIKKAIRLSFILIIVLIIVLSSINWLVVKQIMNNHTINNKIHDLVSFQNNMAFILKDSIKTSNEDELKLLITNFLHQEEELETTREFIDSRQSNGFFNSLIEEVKQNSLIKQNLKQLYKNEKTLEQDFEQVIKHQHQKFQLIQNFKQDYPVEKNIRGNIEKKIIAKKDLNLLKTFSSLKYYSKETLFQHKNKKYLNKWLAAIHQLKGHIPDEQLKNYIDIVSTLANYILEIESINQIELNFERKIQNLLEDNHSLNDFIIETIEALSSDFIYKINLLFVFIALFCIAIIMTLSFKVYHHVGLSVDEIEHKIQAGLAEVNSLNHEIENTQKEVVFTMGAIGESRSKETGNHVKRVALYSELLARYYGLPEIECEMLKQASPMHDIGKVAIPDNILNKPARFTPDEFEQMKEHARLGYEMLKHSGRPLLKMAATVAYEHHEKWDGTGYPRGISGENIHIYGRITALADVFDALGSSRIYKPAWEDKKIFQLFHEERGKHFDPRLVDIFFEHLDEFLTIRDKLKDM